MTTEELQDTIIAVAAKACNADPATVTLDTRWREDLSVKSVYTMKICALIKLRVGVDVNPADLAGNETIADTVALVQSRL